MVGQDISIKALRIAADRYKFPNIKTTNKHVLDLEYPAQYFDMIISNRVLQHVPPGKIEEIIKKIVLIGKNIYINELTDSDGLNETFFMFKHDYTNLFSRYGFRVCRNGLLGRQTWFLFRKG